MSLEYIYVTSHDDLNPGTSDFAIEIVAKIPTQTTPDQYIASKGDADAVGGWVIWIDSSGHINAQLHSSTYVISGSTDVADNTEKYIVLNCDRSGSMTLYVNGASAGTVSIAAIVATSITNTYNVNIGCRENADGRGGYLAGYVRQFRYYKRILTATDIAKNYADRERLYDKTSLYCWLKMDEGSGSCCVDASGYLHPGTISGATWSTVKYVGCLICVDRNKAAWVKEGENVMAGGPLALFDKKLVMGCGESGGTKPNLVYLDEDTNTEQGTGGTAVTFVSEYQSPELDSGAPDIQKRIKYVMIEYRDRLAYTGSSFNIWYRLDGGTWNLLTSDAAITLGTADKTITKNYWHKSEVYYRCDFMIESEYDLEVSRIMIYPELETKAGNK